MSRQDYKTLSNSVARRISTAETLAEKTNKLLEKTQIDENSVDPNRFKIRVVRGISRGEATVSGRKTSSSAIRTSKEFRSDEQQQDYIGGLLLSDLSFSS